MKTLLLKIITPEQVLLEQEILQVTLPIQDGLVTILPEHIPYIGSLKAGEITLYENATTKQTGNIAVSGGFVEFHNNVLTVLADTAEHADAIDIQRAEEARKRAEELMKHKQIDVEEYARVSASLEKQLARLHVARKHRTHHSIVENIEENA